jgi:hypothetical protein
MRRNTVMRKHSNASSYTPKPPGNVLILTKLLIGAKVWPIGVNDLTV